MKTCRNCLSCGRWFWADPEECRGERNGWCDGRHNCLRCQEIGDAIMGASVRSKVPDCPIITPEPTELELRVNPEYITWLNREGAMQEIIAAIKAGKPNPKFKGKIILDA